MEWGPIVAWGALFVDNRDALLIRGCIPIIPTPFASDEAVDFAGLRSLIEFAVACKFEWVCLPAYASEFYKLSDYERQQIISTAIDQARNRVKVIAQCNHPSARVAAEIGRQSEELGASALVFSIPREFLLGEKDVYRHLSAILENLHLPIVIQDFNPGGSTISPQLVATLHSNFRHFRYFKLEEPLMGTKVQEVIELTRGEVGIIEGWGGMYLLELLPWGICGLMPGLAVADILQTVFQLGQAGQWEQARQIFSRVLPQISFSLVNMEVFHHAEKRLLRARGILKCASVREPTVALPELYEQYIDSLNEDILKLLEELGMPANPSTQVLLGTVRPA